MAGTGAGFRGLRLLALVVALFPTLTGALACKKEPQKTGAGAATTSTVENAGDPASPPVEGVGPSVHDDPLGPHPVDIPDTEPPRDNIDIPTGTQFVPGAPAVPGVAAPVDPLEGSIASAKAGAVACFAKLPPGEWSATLVVTVTPTGTVTRSEVEPGNVQDEGTLSCLRTYAASLSFAQSEGRTVRIEVRVKG